MKKKLIFSLNFIQSFQNKENFKQIVEIVNKFKMGLPPTTGILNQKIIILSNFYVDPKKINFGLGDANFLRKIEIFSLENMNCQQKSLL